MKTTNIKILAIDTSCDDTSVAILKDDRVLSNVVSSQIDLHRKWGGVVPMLAKRAHKERIQPCVEQALREAGIKPADLDAVAVTYGPGLSPALEVGVQFAKVLARDNKLHLIAVNHLAGHILSSFLKNEQGKFYTQSTIPEQLFPMLAFVISGGHTQMYIVKQWGVYQIIGQTLDDAAGEAFDKVARLLDLPYPGGPQISQHAHHGNAQAYDFPRPMKDRKDLNFSFAGLKTSCLYKSRELNENLGEEKFKKILPDFCASFQEAVVDSLLIKLNKAITQYNPRTVVFGGGVIANNRLREKVKDLLVPVIIPNKKFCMDNAAMIGLSAYHQYLAQDFVDPDQIDRDPVAEL